ncbi:hypothetical protein [uncultured Sphingomonas sp.]|uniref:hypothetical protein n=1 Tax=uncultured Sphingomonas sp. TaxID=158754 RepID=UPI0025CF3E12|nr:hypothetical protein [uncultured Sphingomonas sp.]
MADPNNKLPEGTDTIIGGAGSGGGTGGTGRSGTAGSAATTSTQTNATGGQTRTTDSSDATDALITGAGAGGTTGAATAGNSALGSSGTATGGSASMGGTAGAGSSGGNSSDSSGTGGKSSGVRGLVSNAGGKLRDESKNKIHGLASQGLERGSSTLTNIAGIVDDTVQQIEERLGPQYGEYARKASQAINGYATTLQNKNPDELVDDARALVRKSPTVALTGAAVLGFGLARLLKIGLEESQYGTGNRNNDRTGTAG